MINARAWSVDCGAHSLNQRVCIKPANHEGDHRADDGRTWATNQNWQAEVDAYFKAQGIDSANRGTDKIDPCPGVDQ